MGDADNKKPPGNPAGVDALVRYRAYGGGMDLFLAYIERRKADQEHNEKRKAEVIEAITPAPGCGVPTAVFNACKAELTMLQILEELDPVIQDLLCFCKKPGCGDDQLPNVRSALRIGKGKAPSDVTQADRKRQVQACWIQAYLEMQESGNYRIQNDIAKDIAKKFGVSQSIVNKHWAELRKIHPFQDEWAKRCQGLALRRAKIKSVTVRELEDSAARGESALTPKKKTIKKPGAAWGRLKYGKNTKVM